MVKAHTFILTGINIQENGKKAKSMVKAHTRMLVALIIKENSVMGLWMAREYSPGTMGQKE